MRRERSAWTLGAILAAAVLLGSSLFLPWFAFHHSTGSTTPPGSDSGDSGVIRRDIYYAPFATRGDPTQDQRDEAVVPTLLLGILVAAAFALSAVGLLLESVWGVEERLRRVQLALVAVGAVLATAAAAFTWITFPPLLASEGVTSVFTTRNDQATFTRSTLSFGWTAAVLSVVAQTAAFAFKYAAGVFNVGMLERYRSESR